MPTIELHRTSTAAWFDLMVPDGAMARAFYGKVFGWSYRIAGPETGHYALAQVNGASAAGIGQPIPGSTFPAAWTVYFSVDHADKTASRIEALGGEVVMPPFDIPSAGRMVIAQDPTGAVFGLWQAGKHRGAQIADEPGAMTWCETNTRDAENSCTFYSELLNLRSQRLDAGPQLEYYTLHHPNEDRPVAGVRQMDDSLDVLVPGHWLVYFAVANLKKTIAAIKSLHGVIRHGPFETPYGKVVVATDNQGARFCAIELSQPHG